MKTLQFKTIDRAAKGWPSGEWDGEPDKVQWPDEATGLPCLAVRNRNHGNWCGYVGVTEGHRYFGKDWDGTGDLDVHGGITFGDHCQPGSEETGICHAPEPGEPDHVWWLGFDCAHAWDHCPDDVKRAEQGGMWAMSSDTTYRTLAYVQSQCRKLAAQLVAEPATA